MFDRLKVDLNRELWIYLVVELWENVDAPPADPSMEDVDALIHRGIGAITRLQAVISESSLRRRDHQLNHDTLKYMINDAVIVEMAAIHTELS